MTNNEMLVAIARAEGVMMALYGFCRDMVIGCSVDEDKNGKLGDVVGDVMHGLVEVYQALDCEEDVIPNE